MLSILILNFFVQSLASGYVESLTGKYNRSISCEDILDMYNIKDLEHTAADEFQYFYNKEAGDRKIQPTLKCFCKYQADLDDGREDTNLSEQLKLAKNQQEELKK